MNRLLQAKGKRLMSRKSFVLILSVVLSLCAASIAVLAARTQATSASGSGQLGNSILTFSAVKHTNNQTGFTTGIAQQHDITTGMKITLGVNCIRVHDDGETATIGGSVLGTIGGGEFVFQVKDNGEGGNVIDELNMFHQCFTCTAPCDDSEPTMPSNPDRGNIQVRGGN